MADEQDQQTSEEAPEEEPLEYKKRKRKPAGGRGGLEGGLNINSMMDIMTILLVFLLMSITADPLQISQSEYLKLAKSTAEYKPESSVPITITEKNILVDSKEVVPVDCSMNGQVCQPDDYTRKEAPLPLFSVDKTYKKDSSESSFTIEPLLERLQEMVEQQKKEAAELQREFKPVATVICDRFIPYRVIAEVVHTAGMAGLSDLRFAIVKTSSRAPSM